MLSQDHPHCLGQGAGPAAGDPAPPALSSALIAIIVGLQFGNLLGGTVVETVFPVRLRLAYPAILAKDFPIVQGVVLVLVLVYVLLNVAVDLSYGLLDPRIRYE